MNRQLFYILTLPIYLIGVYLIACFNRHGASILFEGLAKRLQDN